ncbi:MAG TPA: gfo/Idh/MocA family oxidoreductase, partial [Allosphingosinicella sp.]
AAEALAGKRIASMQITWHEDVRKWHPGQQWIWEPGGFGVFDPGINAFSIATKIFPGALFIREAELIYPDGKQTPIAAEIRFASPAADGELGCSLDWRRSEGEEWAIEIETSDGVRLKLSEGGSTLEIGAQSRVPEGTGEYPDLYRQFVDLIDARRSHVDVAPLRLVSDAFLLGRRTGVEPFES